MFGQENLFSQNKEAEELWSYAMEKYYDEVKYDGIWLDMNEPAMIMVDDIERGELLPEGYTFDENKNPFEKIPYVPEYRENHPTIRGRTLSENCYSKLLEENKFLYGYNFKPLIPYLETKITYEQFINIQHKRPFILSRSTSLGQGKYGFHWLGDNNSNYKDMKNGIKIIFQFQIYGIPLTGDDICGFNEDTWDSLCARWMSLGAFFPFSRNHNSINRKPQEPYAFGENSKTYISSKIALNMRYSLLRYYYTELFKISLGLKGAFFKPVFFEFYKDEKAYEQINESAMIGDALIIYPIFSDETFFINVYLPKWDWYTFPSGEEIRNKNEAGFITLSGEFDNINIFMRGGYILPFQDTSVKFIPNSYQLHNESTQLIIITNSESHEAEGELIFDDNSFNTLETNNYYHIKIKFFYNTLDFYTYETMKTSYNFKDIYVSKFRFINMKYLLDEGEKYDSLIITCKSGKRHISSLIYKIDFKIEADLSSINLKFNEIKNIKFGHLKFKSNYYSI